MNGNRTLGRAGLLLMAALPFSQVVRPIMHGGARIKRNAKCPCGSGKKFKACHMPGRAPDEVDEEKPCKKGPGQNEPANEITAETAATC
jgi:hypothetical protein